MLKFVPTPDGMDLQQSNLSSELRNGNQPISKDNATNGKSKNTNVWVITGGVCFCIIGAFLYMKFMKSSLAPQTNVAPSPLVVNPNINNNNNNNNNDDFHRRGTIGEDGLPRGMFAIVDRDDLYVVPGFNFNDENVYNSGAPDWMKAFSYNRAQQNNYGFWVFRPTGAEGIFEIIDAHRPDHKLATRGDRSPIVVKNPRPGWTKCQWQVFPVSKTSNTFYIKSTDNNDNPSVFLGGGDNPNGWMYLYGPDYGGVPDPSQHRCTFSLLATIPSQYFHP